MKTEHGSATLVVLTLLALLVSTVIVNSLALGQLRAELHRIERQQQKKFQVNAP
jgi:hypothetical protein